MLQTKGNGTLDGKTCSVDCVNRRWRPVGAITCAFRNSLRRRSGGYAFTSLFSSSFSSSFFLSFYGGVEFCAGQEEILIFYRDDKARVAFHGALTERRYYLSLDAVPTVATDHGGSSMGTVRRVI